MSLRISFAGRRALALTGAVAALALTACTPPGEPSSQPPGPGTPPPPREQNQTGSFEGTLQAPGGQGSAFTYNQAVAPEGATVKATVEGSEQSSVVNFQVTGLLPNRGYAVHAHTNACGATGDAAGPHFQNRQDPAASPQNPSSDPAYANPQNEIWLDLQTDARGAGSASANVPFDITGDRTPKSIVVHEASNTNTAAGQAGTAGARAACLNIQP
ncbi:superoxide dismutase family protein [Saccharopolyspora sp. MS10]|uniref:superoxide dismutase family protein n=1 Tax=Saccharopolyspora sp. MS10 TaxID=3385973 RepID=UPI0039A0A3AF